MLHTQLSELLESPALSRLHTAAKAAEEGAAEVLSDSQRQASAEAPAALNEQGSIASMPSDMMVSQVKGGKQSAVEVLQLSV